MKNLHSSETFFCYRYLETFVLDVPTTLKYHWLDVYSLYIKTSQHVKVMTKSGLLLIFLSLVRNVIPLKEIVMIVSAESPEYELTIEDQVIRLKNTKTKHHKVGDPNLLMLYLENGDYRIKFLKHSLYKKEGVNEVIGEMFSNNDRGFFFDLVSTDDGLQIRIDHRCLMKSDFDEERDGYIVELEPCIDDKKQKFIIKRIPL